jgi:surface protein
MTACSNDELLSVNTASGNAIAFNTHVDKSTRTTDITSDNVGSFAKGFAVYGFTAAKKTGTDNAVTYTTYESIFDNELVKGDATNGYSYDNIQYWEEGNRYRFHAIAPYGYDEADDQKSLIRHWVLTTDTQNPEKATIEFTNIASTTANSTTTYSAAGEQDLVYAFNSVDAANASGNDKVDFSFSHLLSRVKFSINGVDNNPTNVSISVKDISIKQAGATGSITITNKSGDNVLANSTSTTVADEAWTINSRADLPFGAAKAVISTKKPTEIVDDKKVEGDAVNSTETDHKYLIPEEATYKATVTLELKAGVSATSLTHTYTYTKDIDLLPIEMEKGKSYIYVLTVDVSGSSENSIVEPIIFNTKAVEAWGDDFEEVKKQSYVVETIVPSATNYAINILEGDENKVISREDGDGDEHFPIDDSVEAIYIDGKKMEQVGCKYKFSTTDAHTVKIVMKEGFHEAYMMFKYCSDITAIDLSHLDTSNVTNFDKMFYGCTGLTSLDLSSLDTSNVTDMGQMFAYCSKLSKIIMSGDVSKVGNNISYMFDGVASTGTFYYPKNDSSFDYSNILKLLPSGWTSADISELNK